MIGLDIGREAMVCIFLVLVLPVALASPPLVSCIGCENKKTSQTTNGIDRWQTFYAKESNRIVLEGSSGFWEYENGQDIGTGSSISLNVAKSGLYILRTENGDFYATIIVSPLSSCVPEWRSEIKINGDEYAKDDTRETAAGEELDFSVRVKSGCQKYQVEWIADPPAAVAFNNPRSLSTKGYVAKDYSGENPTVMVVLTSENGDNRRQQSAKLMILDNSAPTIKIRTDSPIYSFESFNVYFDGSNSGNSGDGDYIEKIEVWLRDENGIQVSSKQKIINKGQSLPILQLKPEAVGVYTLTVEITDSYGAIAEKTTTILVTKKGGTSKDTAMIDVPEHVYCFAGERCKIPVNRSDKSVSVRYYYGDKSTLMASPFYFSEGTHQVWIYAYYFDWKREREYGGIWKPVWIHAAVNDSNASIAVAEPADDWIAQEEFAEPQETPLGRMPMIALPIVAWRMSRRRRTSKS